MPLPNSSGLLCILGLCAGACSNARVNLYRRIEERIANAAPFDNPFTDTELRLDVAAPAGRPLGASFTWYGFHDGDGAGGQAGTVWKFRLLLDYPGAWKVKAGFYAPGTSTPNGPSRRFAYDVSPTPIAGEHGHVRVDPRDRLRLRHDDGTPWAPFSFMSSNLLDGDLSRARRWIDEHAERGIDALAVRFHSDSKDPARPGHWHFLRTDGRRADAWPAEGAAGFDYARFDVASWRHNEIVMDYAQSRGVKLSIWFGLSGLNRQYHSYGPADHPNNAELGPRQKLFVRYFLARWAPYTCWWHWTVDSEYEETGAGALERVRAWAAELRAGNPWKTPLTTHVLRDWTPGRAPEFDLATIQRRVADTDPGAVDCRRFISGNGGCAMPVYNSEGVWHLSNATRSRVGVWAHLMAGGYGAIAHDRGLPSRRGSSSWSANWDDVNPRHKEDAEEIGKMARFFNRTPGVDLGRCAPHDELASVRGGNLALCLAAPGRRYYVWADEGGTVTLDLSGVPGRFAVTRYRCTELERPAPQAAVAGGAPVILGGTPTSGFGEDYLFAIERAGEE